MSLIFSRFSCLNSGSVCALYLLPVSILIAFLCILSKNHNILGAAGPVYTLSAVTAQDEGEYQCRAVSAAGKRLSKVAELKVAGKMNA